MTWYRPTLWLCFVTAGFVLIALTPRAWAGGETEACCLIDGTCSEVDAGTCEKSGGLSGGAATCEKVLCPEVSECRVTGGGNDTFGFWDGSFGKGQQGIQGDVNRYTFGGQAGAPTASQPQPFGEWQHNQHSGPDGTFAFHMGTASSPEESEIDVIECSDPGFCNPARRAPSKQIDFAGVGVFHNIRNPSPSLSGVVARETLHWAEVHIEDLGEPGKGGRVEPASPECPAEGSAGLVANCDCPDFYRITIHENSLPTSPVIYEVFGYITGGNLQIHPAID